MSTSALEMRDAKPQSEALAPVQQQQLLQVMPNGQLDIVSMGRVLAQSGYFKDIKSLSQGVVKIMLGQELGLGPLMSIMKLYIVKESPVISANLMAARIRQSGVYDYEVLELDNTRCKIRFMRKKDGQWKAMVPDVTFTIDDAIRAQLGGLNSQYNPKKGKDFDPDSNWAKWPRNMVFARCMSDGYRFQCPDVFSMSVYTPGDFEVPIDAAGEIMRDVTPSPEPKPEAPAASSTSAIDRIVAQKQKAPATVDEPPKAAEPGPQASNEISDDQHTVIQDLMNEVGVKIGDVQQFMKQELGYQKGLVRKLKPEDYGKVIAWLQGQKKD